MIPDGVYPKLHWYITTAPTENCCLPAPELVVYGMVGGERQLKNILAVSGISSVFITCAIYLNKIILKKIIIVPSITKTSKPFKFLTLISAYVRGLKIIDTEPQNVCKKRCYVALTLKSLESLLTLIIVMTRSR